jgi:hypothetical protein
MTLDEIITKYGTHELDIDFCERKDETTIVFAYCHQHDVEGQFMKNYFLMISGKITALKMVAEDETDISIHIASIDKLSDETYEINGVGDFVHFSVEGDLVVEELSEEVYESMISQSRK